MSRVYNFSAGPAVLPEEVLSESSSRNDGLQRNRNVGNGNESPLAGLPERLSTLLRQI